MGCICDKSSLEIYKNSSDKKSESYKLSSSYIVMNNLSYKYKISEIFDVPKKNERVNNNSFYSESINYERKKYSKFSYDKIYADGLLKEINNARCDCEKYSYKLDSLEEKIKIEKNQSFLIMENGFKVNLIKGKRSFRECSNYLKDLNSYLIDNFTDLNVFQEIEELRIPFPIDESIDIFDQDYINKCQMDLALSTLGKFELVEFVYQISVNYADVSIVLNLVDEYTTDRKVRECLLSEKIKYVGINTKRIDEYLNAIYMVFAN